VSILARGRAVSRTVKQQTAPRVAAWLIAISACTGAEPSTPREASVDAMVGGAARIEVSVDATSSGTPLEQVWPFYGYDELNYTTTPEGKALLSTLATMHSAPVHVRSHFLFNSGDGTSALKWGSTNVYSEDESGQPIYSWALTDQILDSLTGSGAVPFVELGFMPQALSTHPNPYRNVTTTALNSGCFYPPEDHSKWAELVRNWALHASQRYPNVAASWLWELWNEPDSAYWHGSFDDYAKLYDYSESALHQAIPDAPLGGPAVIDPSGAFLTQFLDHCATGTNAVNGQTGTRLDLVTFHAKGGTAISGDHVQMDLGHQLRLHRAGFDAVARSAFKHTPIYISEADPDGCAACLADILPASGYRHATAYGAYELAMMKRTLELEAQLNVRLGGVLTWAFTFPSAPYFAGYRELASHGINLPVLSALQLLGRLTGARLPLISSGARPLDDVLQGSVRGEPDIDGIAAAENSVVRILLWNYHDDVVAGGPAPLHLTVKIPASFGTLVRVSHLRVDASHGDAYAVWVAQGRPESPSAAEITALQQAMQPSPLVPDDNIAVDQEHAIAVDFDLPRFGVSLLTIVPAAQSTADAGIDDKMP
jgi:xylan 1,4-beta-xylosidase